MARDRVGRFVRFTIVPSALFFLLSVQVASALPPQVVSYSRAYDLGPAGHIDDLGLIDGMRHLVIEQNGEIRIIEVSSAGFTTRARITNPLSGDWGHMLTVVPDINGDDVNDIATYGRDSQVTGDHTFYVLSGNQPPGAVVDGSSAAIYTIPFGQTLPRYASVKPGSNELLLTEFSDMARRRNVVTAAILHTVTGTAISNGGIWIGDLDGDTIPDYLTGGEHLGVLPLYAISGADMTDGLAASRAIRTFSDSETPGLGYAEDNNNIAAALGDVNGDNVSDIAVGSRLYQLNPDSTNFGRVVVFDGATGSVLYRIEPDQTHTNGVYFGNNIVAPGDMNGDGIGDFLVSARGYSQTPGGFGDGAIIGFNGVNGAELFRYYGNQERMGDYEVAAISDLNGDGVPDLGVGSVFNGSIWLSNLADGSLFYTLTPCRLIDTRNPAGPYGSPALVSEVERVFTVSGQCGVPESADAVSVNLTVVNPSAPGHLTLYPENQAPPPVSMINFDAGQVGANNAILPLAQGKFVVRPFVLSNGSVDLIVDINGYFD